jgi:hypothetical protein
VERAVEIRRAVDQQQRLHDFSQGQGVRRLCQNMH